ncbi:MAG: hypothetical protein AAF518_11480 [Spirochaetota bacterium]
MKEHESMYSISKGLNAAKRERKVEWSNRLLAVLMFLSIGFNYLLLKKLWAKKYGLDNLCDLELLFVYTIPFHLVFLSFFYFWKQNSPSAKIAMSHDELGQRIGLGMEILVLNGIPLFLDIACFCFLAYFNCYFDTSKPVIYKTVLFQHYYISDSKDKDYGGKITDICFKIKHWEKEEAITGFRVCYNKNPRGVFAKEVRLVVKAGSLGIPWVQKYSLLD